MSKIVYTKGEDTKFVDKDNKEVVELLENAGWKVSNKKAPKVEKEVAE